MSKINCESCDNLRNHAPEFVQNGVTDNICTSLQNNTGLNPSLSVLHENAEDLHDVNDCTIGRMTQEIDAYDVCDWKEFMKKLVPNIYEHNKAQNCSDKGQWDNIERIWCWLNNMVSTPSPYVLHAYENDDPSRPPVNNFRIVDGVRMRGRGQFNDPITIQCLGSSAFINGSLEFFGNMPTSYTDGQTVSWKHLQHGSTGLRAASGRTWGINGECDNMPLIWEIQFNACEVGFKDFFGRVTLGPDWAGDFNMQLFLYKYGESIPTDDDIHVPSYTFLPSNHDRLLMQLRLQNTRIPLASVTPNGMATVIACPGNYNC